MGLSRLVLAICGSTCGVLAASYLNDGCGTKNVYQEALHLEVLEGRKLSGEEVAARERQLREDPADLVLRAGLLGYYWPHPGRDAHAGHVVWFIENAPESPALQPPWRSIMAVRDPEGYVQVKEAWLRQIEREPNNVTFLERASDHLSNSDAPLARELLERGRGTRSPEPLLGEEARHSPLAGGRTFGRRVGSRRGGAGPCRLRTRL